ncbi:MAG: alpha/beta hydrolase [Bacteroidia bacterium]|nr:alpha/beta hydrolase [Bacteroidia bacterium]
MNAIQPIYFIPGLGTTRTIFEKTAVPQGFQKHYIDWIEPISDIESLRSYSARLLEQVLHPNPIFVGMSFGGLVALELSNHFQSKKVLLISSFRNKHDLTFPIRTLLKAKPYKFIPDIELSAVRRIVRRAYAIRSAVPVAKLLAMMGDHSPRYLRWSVRMIDEYQPNLLHKPEIHSIIGDKDSLVKVWKDYPSKVIPGGTHIAVYEHAHTVNDIIAEILKGNG